MANKKISELGTGTTANASDKIPIERGGSNFYITPTMLRLFAISGPPTGTSAQGTDRIPIDRSGTVLYVTPAMVKTYIGIGLIARFTVSNDTVPATDLVNLEFTADYDPSSTLSAVDTFTAPATAWYTFILSGGSRVNANGTIWADGDKLTVTTYVNGSGGETLAWEAVAGASTATNIHLPLVGTNTLELTSGDDVIFELENFTGANRVYIGGTLTVLRVT